MRSIEFHWWPPLRGGTSCQNLDASEVKRLSEVPNRVSVAMQADDGVPGPVAEDGEGQASSGDPGSHDGPGGHQDPRRAGSGEAEAVAREAPQAAQALGAPGPSADAEPAPRARIRRRVPLQFILLVPFRSSLEAEIACHLMAFGAQPQPAARRQEVRVSGNHLAIRLTAEDMDQLRLSITYCLHQLFMLIETMQHILPPFYYGNPRTMNGG